MIIAAICLGSDPIGPLPPSAFHRTLEEHIYCPKCDATYSLVVDYDWAISRHFDDESRRHLSLLRKTIFRGHSVGHRITHFETNGVTVTAHTASRQSIPLEALQPMTKQIN